MRSASAPQHAQPLRARAPAVGPLHQKTKPHCRVLRAPPFRAFRQQAKPHRKAQRVPPVRPPLHQQAKPRCSVLQALACRGVPSAATSLELVFGRMPCACAAMLSLLQVAPADLHLTIPLRTELQRAKPHRTNGAQLVCSSLSGDKLHGGACQRGALSTPGHVEFRTGPAKRLMYTMSVQSCTVAGNLSYTRIPVASSRATTPTAHMSAAWLIGSPMATTGARYGHVVTFSFDFKKLSGAKNGADRNQRCTCASHKRAIA